MPSTTSTRSFDRSTFQNGARCCCGAAAKAATETTRTPEASRGRSEIRSVISTSPVWPARPAGRLLAKWFEMASRSWARTGPPGGTPPAAAEFSLFGLRRARANCRISRNDRAAGPRLPLRSEADWQLLLTYLPLSVVDGALNYWAKCVTEPEPVSPPVEEVTGVLAHPLCEWAVDFR